MKKRTFQLIASVLVAMIALPFAIYVVYERPFSERVWWFGGMSVLALLFRFLVYEPLARRFQDH